MNDPLVYVFREDDWKSSDAHFWEWLREDHQAWAELKYLWIAQSQFGDQIILTENSPIHVGQAIYMHGPDIAGPESSNPDWPDSVLFLGSSLEEWQARIQKYGDEYSVIPGGIDELLEAAEEYRNIYRTLNPGLKW